MLLLQTRRVLAQGLALALTFALGAGCESGGSGAETPSKKAKDDNARDKDDPESDDAEGKNDGGSGKLGGRTNGQEQEQSDGDNNSSGQGDQSDDDNGAGLTEKVKKRITFAGSRGDQVPGYLWLPKRKAGQKFPAVLLMYGIKGNKDDGSIAKAADVLNDAGFVAMTMDWPGTGERGSIGNTERITKVDTCNWTVGDYQAGVNFLTQQPEVDGQRLAYVGASMGAMTGLSFVAKDARMKGIVAIVPIPNPLWGSEDPSATIGRVSPRPVLCISTNDNSDFSGAVCGNVGAGGEKKALPGGHELEGFRDQVVVEAKTFLVKLLKP